MEVEIHDKHTTAREVVIKLVIAGDRDLKEVSKEVSDNGYRNPSTPLPPAPRTEKPGSTFDSDAT